MNAEVSYGWGYDLFLGRLSYSVFGVEAVAPLARHFALNFGFGLVNYQNRPFGKPNAPTENYFNPNDYIFSLGVSWFGSGASKQPEEDISDELDSVEDEVDQVGIFSDLRKKLSELEAMKKAGEITEEEYQMLRKKVLEKE